MPDHVHMVIGGRAGSADARRFVALGKQRSGYWFANVHGVRLWQEGWFDRVLRDDDDPTAVIRYVVLNPLRARLVARLADYPFWGSQRYSRAEIESFVETAGEWEP